MFAGFFIAIVTLVTLYFIHLNSIAIVRICLAFPSFLGYGIFEANVIQFNNDQLYLHHLKS